MNAQEWKEQGNGFLKNKEYEEAIKCYTEAINIDPKDHIHYSNRSVGYFNQGNFEKALEDAIKCVEVKPDWGKGYLRKGMAEFKLDKTEEAVESYKKGLELEPNNQQLKDNLKECEDIAKNPFAKNYSKLFTDPRTVKYMGDVNFRNLLEYAMKDQKVLMQMVQTDPRFMDVFSVLTGIDLTMMNEQAQKGQKMKDHDDKERKKHEEEERIKNAEDQKKKEEEDKWASMSQEERDEASNKKKVQKNLKYKGTSIIKKEIGKKL